MDEIVHHLYNTIAEKIDCTKCSNCCRIVRPILDDEDISRFASGLKMEMNDFKTKYITFDRDMSDEMIFNQLPCPFLKNKICLNYDHRPKDCKSYPHMHKDEIITRLWGIIDNYSICPIVFNVYEQMKFKLWHISEDEYDKA